MNKSISLALVTALLCASIQAFAQVSQRDSLMLDSVEATLTENLKQVEVNASNIVHLQDKDIIYITKEMRKGTSDTGELLGTLPGMSYNPLTRELRYQGQRKILLLVDSLQYSDKYIKTLHHMRFHQAYRASHTYRQHFFLASQREIR